MESNERPPPRASPGSLRLPSPPLRPPGRRPVRRLLPSAEAQAHPQTPQRTPEPERGGEKARGRRARNSLSRVLAPGEPGPSGRGGARSLALCTDGPETTRAWRKLRSQRDRVRTGRRPEQGASQPAVSPEKPQHAAGLAQKAQPPACTQRPNGDRAWHGVGRAPRRRRLEGVSERATRPAPGLAQAPLPRALGAPGQTLTSPTPCPA